MTESLQYGLPEKTLSTLRKVFMNFPVIDRVYFFGSRVNGNYDDISDLDLAVCAPDMSLPMFRDVWAATERLNIRYDIDLIHLDRLEDHKIMGSIRKKGKTIWER